MFIRGNILLVLFACSLPLSAQVVTLDSLLQETSDSAELSALDAEIAIADAERQLLDGKAGWSAFASVTSGNYDELVVEGSVDEYSGQSAALGLRYPLLGTLRERARAVQAAGLTVEQGKLQRELLQAEHRLAVRVAYADWWQTQTEAAICQRAQGTLEETEETIANRLDEGEIPCPKR